MLVAYSTQRSCRAERVWTHAKNQQECWAGSLARLLYGFTGWRRGDRWAAVLGASDKIGAYPDSDPVTPADFAATIFWRFGIDPATEVTDQTGRPFRLTEGEPIRKLFGS